MQVIPAVLSGRDIVAYAETVRLTRVHPPTTHTPCAPPSDCDTHTWPVCRDQGRPSHLLYHYVDYSPFSHLLALVSVPRPLRFCCQTLHPSPPLPSPCSTPPLSNCRRRSTGFGAGPIKRTCSAITPIHQGLPQLPDSTPSCSGR